jgi:hypothetical protein
VHVVRQKAISYQLMQLRPVPYHFRDYPADAPRTLGLIAQAVEPVFPEVIGECHGTKSVAYGELVPATIGAIQELNRRLTQQLDQNQAELRESKRHNEALENRPEALERHFQNQELN